MEPRPKLEGATPLFTVDLQKVRGMMKSRLEGHRKQGMCCLGSIMALSHSRPLFSESLGLLGSYR